MIIVEACVTSLDESIDASSAGADRLELCRDLHTGGLTPSLSLLTEVRDCVSIPVNVMVRPHPGEYSAAIQNLDDMLRQVCEFSEGGADGIVLGVLDDSFRIDITALIELMDAAGDIPVTFHRAFDLVDDQMNAAEILIEAGVSRILTGGGKGTALEGSGMLRQLVHLSGEDLIIMAGGSVRGNHAVQLVEQTGVMEVHARASAIPGVIAALRIPGYS